MNTKKAIVFAALFATLVLLYLGITFPILSTQLKLVAATPLGTFEHSTVNQSFSIIGTVEHLMGQNKLVVGLLILLFSVIVPVLKIVLLPLLLFPISRKKAIGGLLNTISKWSMADVFTVAVILAHLSFQNENSSSFNRMGMTIKVSLDAISELQSGFYFFTAYCLLSILVTQLVVRAFGK